ncbi:MAG: hypothetical protein LBK72_09715 [Bifidobacteriaceae bacterium]|jgi:hypothetical protein|nr:hypothetical protein [Bifidobacteriaceae bacterium]
MRKNWLSATALVCLTLGLGTLTQPAGATQQAPPAPTVAAAKQAGPSVATRVVKGTKKTDRYMPASYRYSLKLPTLKGVTAKVAKAFEKRIDALVASELRYYAKGAWTETGFRAQLTTWQEQSAAAGGPIMSEAEYTAFCRGNFTNLKGKYTSSVYAGRYASVVLTFTGQNASCVQLGGMWGGYQTERSVTIDTRTGKLMELMDFTSNRNGQVNAALKTWYAKTCHNDANCPKSNLGDTFPLPQASKGLDVCDRTGNVGTDAVRQEPCFVSLDPDHTKTGLLAWQVRDSGLRLTVPAHNGPRYVLLPWKQIPRLA